MWNSFTFRDGDIVIAIYEKAGTTWTQQIVSQLVFEGAANVAVQTISPWVDLPLPPAQEKLAMLDAQRHRRFVKTHLPVDALVYAPEARHLYVGRDGRDIAWSLYNHLVNYTDAYLAQLNSVSGWAGPKLEKPNGSAKEFFLDWIRRDGEPIGPFWEHVRGWQEIRRPPNLLLLHYARLKADLPGEIRRIAAFLGIVIDEQRWPMIVDHCGFDYMKANAERFARHGGSSFKGGAATFIHRGTTDR